jgi:putative acetyltransferase
MDALTITRDSPLAADLALLFDRHTAEMHADTPPESIHMMPRSNLDRPEIAFYVLRDSSGALAMGAVKTIAPGHGEVKSMHVLSEARGRGLSRRLLDHMLTEARAAGLARLSLETGAQESFASARNLYARAGFAECPPFGSYRPDPNSVFMTREL